jgi:hypothetical protein
VRGKAHGQAPRDPRGIEPVLAVFTSESMSTFFLLSPASLNGLRAKQLTSPRAKFELAQQYRTEEGVAIADAFAFMSALYFRGKIAYARAFAATDSIFVITPGYGLVPPDWRITEERMKRMRRTDIDVASRNYVRPLREHARELAANCGDDARVGRRGGVATRN